MRLLLSALMAIAALLLSSCAPEAPEAKEAVVYPPVAQFNYSPAALEEPEAVAVVEDFFSTEKPFNKTVEQHLANRSKYLSDPQVDFFYKFRSPKEIPYEEKLAALKLDRVERTYPGPTVTMRGWAVFYSQEKTANGLTPIFFEWEGTIEVLDVGDGWKIDRMETLGMGGGEGHPSLDLFEILVPAQ